ncbi:MAG: hypothetical protein EXS36_19615 [Pedosphaera sp.]|nr:hypothetical protein [Pedosphaera sp.]
MLPDRWFNDRGQIVFLATAANDGGPGLWVTDGVSSPPPADATAAIRWVGPSSLPPGSPPSGAFGTAGNWLPPNSEPPRVPEKTISRRDIAVFDRPGVYSVTIGDRYNQGVVIKNGDVSFRDGTYKTDTLSFEEPSFVIDNARLKLVSGMFLTNNHALIGLSAASRVDVTSGAGWVTHGSLRVGGPGEGILSIDVAGTVKSAEALIGTGVGGGKVNVAGLLATWETGNIAIGAGGAGELTITDGGHVSSENAVIGQQSGLGNKVRVQGTIPEGQSKWDLRDTLEVGGKGSGRLEILDGTSVNAAFIGIGTLFLDNHHLPYAKGDVTVAGVAGDNTPSRLSAFFLGVGSGGVGELTITNGGRVEAANAYIAPSSSSYGRIVVRGRHPGSNLASTLVVSEKLFLGDGTGILEIDDGGSVEVTKSFDLVRSPSGGQTNEVKVIGSTSRLGVGGKLVVGAGSAPGKAVLTLKGGLVKADSLTVNNNGIVCGFGTLAVAPSARFINDGGMISPGLSPGVLTIQGSYEQRAGGTLLIELAGTNVLDHDQLIVTSDATLDGNLILRFLDGFAPKAGDSFPFLKIGGTMTGEFSSVGLENLAPGFQFQFVTNGVQSGITALNDGVFSSALPGQVQVAITNVGGIAYANYTISTSSTCEKVSLRGPLTRTNNVFSQVFQGTTFVKPDCVSEPATTNGILVLGQLSPGNYSFRIMSNTQVVETVSFTVSADAAQTLSKPIRLADGSLQFEINGLPSIHYTIEVSADLETWSPLNQGVLPHTYVDPDAAIFPRRFYRATIGK